MICKEPSSSLEGLQYSGGPIHKCDDSKSGRVVVPYVSFPDGCKMHWTCDECRGSFDTDALNHLLDPEVSVVRCSMLPLCLSK